MAHSKVSTLPRNAVLLLPAHRLGRILLQLHSVRRRACRPEPTHGAVYEVGALLVSDGKVAIKADATHYKLHTSRLARYYVHFKKLFADDTDDYEDQCAKVDGCPIFHIPTDLDSDDF